MEIILRHSFCKIPKVYFIVTVNKKNIKEMNAQIQVQEFYEANLKCGCKATVGLVEVFSSQAACISNPEA